MKSLEKTILALAVGVTIGAGIGILFAPDKGSRTRRKIKREYDRNVDRVKDKIADIKLR